MEKFDLENFPTSKSAKKMLSYVSDGFYDESYVGKWLFQVMGAEYDKALEIVEDLPAQFFPETATWGLMYHEIKWGLPVRLNLPYEERRRLIYLKRDYRAPMTPYRMERYLEDATGFVVRIADVNDPGEYGFDAPHPNFFMAYFVGEGTLDSKKVREILDHLKQSHTIYKVNDRIEIVLDNRNLEKIILRNVHFKMGIPFWYQYVYDGSWLLDGGVTLNMIRCYGLVLGMNSKLGEFYTSEQIRLVAVKFATRIKNDEIFYARVGNHFGINFWDVRRFSGLWNFESSTLKRRYGLVLNIGNVFKVCNGTENIKLRRLSTAWKQYIWEGAKGRVVYHGAIDFWRLLYLDDNWSLEGELTIRLGVNMSGQETVENVTVETKNRDYWFLNGALSLDGARSLNSIYRKEIAE